MRTIGHIKWANIVQLYCTGFFIASKEFHNTVDVDPH